MNKFLNLILNFLFILLDNLLLFLCKIYSHFVVWILFQQSLLLLLDIIFDLSFELKRISGIEKSQIFLKEHILNVSGYKKMLSSFLSTVHIHLLSYQIVSQIFERLSHHYNIIKISLVSIIPPKSSNYYTLN